MTLKAIYRQNTITFIKKVQDVASQYTDMVIIELSGKIGTIKVECRTAKQREDMWLLFPKLSAINPSYYWSVDKCNCHLKFNASEFTYKGLTRDYFDDSFHIVEIYMHSHGNGIRITLSFFCAKS
jgi:hypothetical protein